MNSIHPKDLYQQISSGKNPTVIDVRTPVEYNSVHIAGSHLIPLDELDCKKFHNQHKESSPPFYFTCGGGSRATRAIKKIQEEGSEDCILIEGGMNGWIDEGCPVERPSKKGVSLMRQVQIIVGLFSALGAALALWIDLNFAWIPLFFGSGLLFAGLSGYCGLALVLAKMPWNSVKNPSNKTSCCTIEK